MPVSKRFLLIITALFFLSGCQNGVLENVRKVTYPPDFNYISQQKLTDTMQTFAWYTTLLDNNLRNTESVTREQRLSAIEILEKMETLSMQLGTETLSSNHDIISFNIDAFRQSIIDARKGLQKSPPNYYLVGTLSGYCINCHSLRQ
ncbi:MAG: lipoprotein [Gammaproteobacteria bacterium]|nr:lipoprotein [Gammaproteobacteria bacterium]